MNSVNWLENISFTDARKFWMGGPCPKNPALDNRVLPGLVWLRVLREAYPHEAFRASSLKLWLKHERELIEKNERTVFKVKNKTFIPLEIICLPSKSVEQLLLLEWSANNVSLPSRKREKTTIEKLNDQCGSDVVTRVGKTLKTEAKYLKLTAIGDGKYSSELSLTELVPLVQNELFHTRYPGPKKFQRQPIAESVLRKAISGFVKTKRGGPRGKRTSKILTEPKAR